MNKRTIKEEIIATISDLCRDFLYYDRTDRDLYIEQIIKAIADGEITVDEMVAEFRKNLENTFNA